ncbi:hypothetical protein ACTG9Q_17790 [Actinokineospora sp. 24-640]
MTELGQATGAASVMVPGFLLGAMAAGALAVAGPAAAEAGGWALAGLVLTVVVAGLTTASMIDLAAHHGALSGYAHVREARGPWMGRVAAVLSVSGRVVAAGALASAAGHAVLPSAPRAAAVAVVVLAAGLVVAGFRPPPAVLHVVIVTLGLVVAACVVVAPVAPPDVPGDVAGVDSPLGVVPAAGLLFLGFAGIERITGVRPSRALLVLGGGAAVLAVVVFAVLRQLGGPRLAASPAPLRDALAAADGTALTPLLVLGLAAAAVLVVRPLLSDVAGTLRELADAGELRSGVYAGQAAAVLAAGVAVALPTGFAVALAVTLLLGYFAVVNSAARTLARCERSSWVRSGCCGLALCVVLAVNVSVPALLAAVAVLLVGAGLFAMVRSTAGNER